MNVNKYPKNALPIDFFQLVLSKINQQWIDFLLTVELVYTVNNLHYKNVYMLQIWRPRVECTTKPDQCESNTRFNHLYYFINLLVYYLWNITSSQ